MLFAGVRRRHEFASAEAGIGEQWREFLGANPDPGARSQPHFGVMCGSDPTGFEYMCAVEVESFAEEPAMAGRVVVPPQTYAIFLHEPSDCTLQRTWIQILEWLSTGEFDSAHLPDFEVYAPGSDPAASTSPIEIWIAVVPRAAGRDADGSGQTA